MAHPVLRLREKFVNNLDLCPLCDNCAVHFTTDTLLLYREFLYSTYAVYITITEDDAFFFF
jgi:hypothetical protein